MSIIRNSVGTIVPIRERREATASFTALNQELVMPLNGDANALVYVLSDLFIGTLEFTGASDAPMTGYFPIQAYTYATGNTGGGSPVSGQPFITDGLVAANITRVYSIPVGQLKALRIRVSAYTSGNLTLWAVTDTNASLNPAAAEADPATLCQSVTGAVNAAVTATLPAVPGLRHVIDSVQVIRSATAALTASATPVVVTMTNLPGPPALTFGSDVAGIGIDKEVRLDCGPEGLMASAINTATTVVCPVYTGVIWRVNVLYHLSS